jgi:hypothetical protein
VLLVVALYADTILKQQKASGKFGYTSYNKLEAEELQDAKQEEKVYNMGGSKSSASAVAYASTNLDKENQQ